MESSNRVEMGVSSDVEKVFTLLDTAGIAYQRVVHPAVLTCEAAAIHLVGVPGLGTKNLFLTDKSRSRYLLVSVPESKRVDLRTLAAALETSKLSFASAPDLLALLGIEPGSVSLLAVVNDDAKKVELVADLALSTAEAIQCHPLVNTQTLVIPWEGILKFLARLGRSIRVINVPSK